MRIYEELFIVRTSTPEEEVDALVEQLRGIIAQSGGNLDKIEKWGTRKLAYRVEKQSEGNYVLLVFSAGSQTVKEIERRLRVSDQVIKFLTVRIDEKLKRIEKRKKMREKRAARKPVQQVAPAVPASPAPPAMPAAPAAPAPAMPEPAAPAPTEGAE